MRLGHRVLPLVCAGQAVLRTVSVAVRAMGGLDARGHGHIADSVRAGGAVRGTACFADPRPFCPVTRRQGCSPHWCMPRIPGGRFSAVLPATDGGLVLFVPAAGAGFCIGPRHPIEAATEAVTSARRPLAGWKTGTELWRATLPADLGAVRAAASCRKGFPVSPRRDWIWLSRSCTCHGLVMYLSCTALSRARENLQDECLTLMGVHVGGASCNLRT